MVKGIYDFLALSETDQFEYTWNHGTFLASRIDGDTGFNLYACCNFYIEIIFNKAANNIEGIRVFKSTSQLEPYLDKVSFPRDATKS